MKTHYEVLGIERDAPPDEIKSAYKARIREVHPDVFQGASSEATERAIELNGAYSVLSDPEKRALYDRMLVGGRPAEKTSPEDHSSETRAEKTAAPEPSFHRGDEAEWAVRGQRKRRSYEEAVSSEALFCPADWLNSWPETETTAETGTETPAEDNDGNSSAAAVFVLSALVIGMLVFDEAWLGPAPDNIRKMNGVLLPIQMVLSPFLCIRAADGGRRGLYAVIFQMVFLLTLVVVGFIGREFLMTAA